MSHILTQSPTIEVHPQLHFVGSDRFVAVSTAVLLHLIVVAMLLAGWQENKPIAPEVKTIKVQMMMQAPAPLVEPISPQAVPLPPVVEASTPVKKEPHAINEAQFAKKRVDEPKVKAPESEPETIAKPELSTSAEAPAKLTQESANQKHNQSNAPVVASANAEANQNFDSSQYFPVQKNAPTYPQRALDRNVQGVCTVRYTVNTLGHTENPEALGDCHAFFIKPSLEAAKSFRYTPRVVDGLAVNVPNVKNTFQYRIE